jgi:hypothetical protein
VLLGGGGRGARCSKLIMAAKKHGLFLLFYTVNSVMQGFHHLRIEMFHVVSSMCLHL